MALRDQPYIPLYVQDFLTDEKLNECSAESTGVYIKIMCVMHKSNPYGNILLKQKDKQKSSKVQNFALKLLRHLPYDLLVIERSLNELIQEDVLQIKDDRLSQKRMIKDCELSIKRAKAGQKGGKKTQEFASGFAKAKSEANTEDEYENEDVIENDIEDVNESWYLEQADFWIERAKEYYPSVTRDRNKFKEDIVKIVKVDKLKIEEVILIQDYLAEKPDTTGFNWFSQIGTPGKLRERSKNADKVKYWELILKDIFKEREVKEPKWLKTYREANRINQERLENEQKE